MPDPTPADPPAVPPAEDLRAAAAHLDNYAQALWQKGQRAATRGVSAWLAAVAAGAVPDTPPAAAPEPDAEAIRAAALCESAAFLVANPQGVKSWLNAVPSKAREHLAVWLRGEAVQFRADGRRGSPSGFPSWHFAQTLDARAVPDTGQPASVGNLGAHIESCEYALEYNELRDGSVVVDRAALRGVLDAGPDGYAHARDTAPAVPSEHERFASEMVHRFSMAPSKPLLPWPELPQDLAFLAMLIDRRTAADIAAGGTATGEQVPAVVIIRVTNHGPWHGQRAVVATDAQGNPPASLSFEPDGSVTDGSGRVIGQLLPSGDTAPAATEHAFLRWLVSMDDPEDVIGREERRTVTLDQIIRRARALLGVPSSTRDGSETS